MLESMRNLAKTWVAKILLGLLVVAFGVWGVSGIAGSAFDSALSLTGWGPKDLAQVGSVTINGDEYTKNLQRMLKNTSAQAGQNLTMDDARKFGFDRQVLDNMISQAAVGTEAKKLKLAVSPQVINSEIVSQRQFQDSTGKFDQLAFSRALQTNGLSEQAYRAMQANMHTDAAILGAASGDLTLPKAFALALGQYQGEARDVKYFDVTASEADVAKPSDADLEAQYKKTPDVYTAPEYRSAALLSIDAAALAPQQSITPEELQAGYDKHRSEYSTPETRDLVQISFPSVDAAKKAKERIQAGEDIMKIAGELGFKESDVTLKGKVKGDFLDQKIAEAAFGVAEGQLSEPIRGGLATALIKAVKVTAAKQPGLDEIKDRLTQQLQIGKAKEQLQQVYNAVEDARGQNMKFEDIAARAGVTLTLLPAVSVLGQDKSGKDIEAPGKPQSIKAIFASDVGVENDALGVGEGYVWYDVRAVVPSALKPLEQVKDQVAKDVLAGRVREAAAAKAKSIMEALKGGKSLDAAAQENVATVKTASGLKRNQQTPEFDGAALKAAYVVADQAFASAAGGDGKSARVMQVVKIVLPAVMATSPELDQAKKLAEAGFGNDLQTALVKALKKSAGVKINESLWKLDTGGEAPPVE
jgi:peptidyl-prolyl cis-trans isomerase D